MSAELRERQRARIAARVPAPRSSACEWLDALPAALDALVIANEVLDAMPTHVVRTCERRASKSSASPSSGDGASSSASTGRPTASCSQARTVARTARRLRDRDQSRRARVRAERRGAAIERGVAALHRLRLFRRAEYYHPQRSRGTLMCHYRHHAHDDPFVLVGPAGHHRARGLHRHRRRRRSTRAWSVLGYTTQAQFLINCGITEMLAETHADGCARPTRRSRRRRRSSSPAEMGELFKVLALGQGRCRARSGLRARRSNAHAVRGIEADRELAEADARPRPERGGRARSACDANQARACRDRLQPRRVDAVADGVSLRRGFRDGARIDAAAAACARRSRAQRRLGSVSPATAACRSCSKRSGRRQASAALNSSSSDSAGRRFGVGDRVRVAREQAAPGRAPRPAASGGPRARRRIGVERARERGEAHFERSLVAQPPRRARRAPPAPAPDLRTAPRSPARFVRARRIPAALRTCATAASSMSPRASSCHTRSGTSASASPLATISRMSSSVSGAMSKPKRARSARRAGCAPDLPRTRAHVPQDPRARDLPRR